MQCHSTIRKRRSCESAMFLNMQTLMNENRLMWLVIRHCWNWPASNLILAVVPTFLGQSDLDRISSTLLAWIWPTSASKHRWKLDICSWCLGCWRSHSQGIPAVTLWWPIFFHSALRHLVSFVEYDISRLKKDNYSPAIQTMGESKTRFFFSDTPPWLCLTHLGHPGSNNFMVPPPIFLGLLILYIYIISVYVFYIISIYNMSCIKDDLRNPLLT